MTLAAALSLGPHLLMDPDLLESFVSRSAVPPVRFRSAPLMLDASRYIYGATVIRDAASGHFRAWLQGKDKITGDVSNAHVASEDGLTWSAPTTLDPMGGRGLVGIIDEGPDARTNRYKLVTRTLATNTYQWPGEEWVSQDGLIWGRLVSPVTANPYGEVWSLFRSDTGLNLLHRWNQPYTWTDAEGRVHAPTAAKPFWRTIGATSSLTGLSFPPSIGVFRATSQDSGETQFYSLSNVLRRGNLYIGIVGIYREDLIASDSAIPTRPAGAFGMGYSALAWSTDGLNWTRFFGSDSHYFDPNPDPAAWDHAFAWVTSLVPVCDEVLMFYSGFQWGHLVRADRQVGLVKIKRDRFMSRHVYNNTPVTMRTKPVEIVAQGLTFNVKGQLQVQITDPANVPIPGFAYADCLTINGDYLDAPLLSAGNLASLVGRAVKLEFRLVSGDLYAFYLR